VTGHDYRSVAAPIRLELPELDRVAAQSLSRLGEAAGD